MDATIQAALDAQAAKLDEVTGTISNEIAEVKLIVDSLKTMNPAEVAAAIDTATARLDAINAAVAGISDAVNPPV